MDFKKLEKELVSMQELEGQDYLDAVKSVVTDISSYYESTKQEIEKRDSKIVALEEKLKGTNSAKLDANLAVATKRIQELEEKLGLRGDKDTRKTYYAINLLNEQNCIHFPEGRMLLMPAKGRAEITFDERNTEYYKGLETAKLVKTVEPSQLGKEKEE